LPHKLQIAHTALVFTEIPGDDLPGGVINEAVEGLLRPRAEPVSKGVASAWSSSSTALRLFRRRYVFLSRRCVFFDTIPAPFKMLESVVWPIVICPRSRSSSRKYVKLVCA
jgi:hypothetical protein